jgi:hypothetical protein
MADWCELVLTPKARKYWMQLCFYEQCDAYLLFVAFSNELYSFAYLTGDG